MHRFYVEGPIGVAENNGGKDKLVTLSPEESAHAARVLRLRPGEAVQMLDGENLYGGELVSVGDGGNAGLTVVKVRTVLPSPESESKITLWQGLPKGDKLETIVQKATELGVWAIWPVEMERSVAKAEKQSAKRQRMQRIALEAAKQSARAHVPQVAETCRFEEALQRVAVGQASQPVFDLIVVAWEEAAGLRLSQAVQACDPRPKSMLVVVGPEGGIAPAECQSLQSLGGRAVTLGRRILRTETAGPCALAVVLATLGEM